MERKYYIYPKKRRINEIEEIDEEDIKDERNTEECWKETSKWTILQLSILRISYENVDFNVMFGETYEKFEETIDLSYREKELILTNFNKDDIYNPEMYNKSTFQEQSLINNFRQILENKNKESLVDQMINDIFYNLGLRKDGFFCDPKPKFKFSILSKDIVSESDIGVYFYSKTSNKEIYLLFDESKSENSYSSEREECQIAGELIATANKNLESCVETEIYALRSKLLVVTIYKAKITKKYIEDIENNGIPKENLNIKRMNEKLNIIEYKDRKKFIYCLKIIKRIMEKEKEKK